MQDVSVHGAAPAAQQGRTREQDGGRPGEAEGGLQSMLDQGQEEIESLTEMIKDAQEKAEAHRNALKMPKNNVRYGDAPLEAYARLARARSAAEVNSASGYARRRIAQFKSSLRVDSENAAKITAAISQLQKAVNRGEKKKRELNREKLEERRKARSEEAEQRMKQEDRKSVV